MKIHCPACATETEFEDSGNTKYCRRCGRSYAASFEYLREQNGQYSKFKKIISADRHELYQLIQGIVGFIVFIVSYIYCITAYGYLLGLGLGWLPSIIVALIAAIFWKLMVFIALIAAIVLAYLILST